MIVGFEETVTAVPFAVVEAQPWGVQFTWKDKSVKVTLKNGEDLIKVAEMISVLLTANGIENTLEDISH